MNTTERVIVEQFPFWAAAPAVEPLKASDAGCFVIVGCGTSYHLAQSIAASFNLQGLKALAVPGGEWSRRRQAFLPDAPDTVVIGLSRSGKSTETVQALEVSRKAGLRTIAVTCEEASSITRFADQVVYAKTHPDEGIVMTASASLMLLMGLRLAGVTVPADAAGVAEKAMAELDAQLSKAIAGKSHIVFLGAGALYGIAAEGGIKAQEMSLSHVQAYQPMEYRHGPVSLIDERSLVVLLYSDETQAEEAKIAAELRAKNATVIGLGGPGDIAIPMALDPSVRGLVTLPALRILGERIAAAKGLDTASPRHLNKVVVLG